MVKFTATIKKFESNGEKSGWTYIEITADIAERLKTGNRKSFRVKGRLDQHTISGVALMPMGGGVFIMALNATLRKGIGKSAGAMLQVALEADEKPVALPAGFMEALADEPAALETFNRLSQSHKGYMRIWITTLKTETGQAKRMAQAVNALAKGQDFVQMVHALKRERESRLK